MIICMDPECETNKGQDVVGECPECGKELKMLHSRAGKRFIGCSGYPDCKRTYPVPQYGAIYSVGEKCTSCSAPMFGMQGKGAWKFCPNMDCPTNEKLKAARKEKAEKAGAKTEGEPKKPKAVKKVAAKKAPAKKPAVKKAAAKTTKPKKKAE